MTNLRFLSGIFELDLVQKMGYDCMSLGHSYG